MIKHLNVRKQKVILNLSKSLVLGRSVNWTILCDIVHSYYNGFKINNKVLYSKNDSC